jgi:hypothetical protein
VRPGVEVVLEGGQRGRVSAVLSSVDPETRRLPIVAEFENIGPKPLLANLFVRATRAPNARTSVLKLPASALRPGSQDELVLISGERSRSRTSSSLARVTAACWSARGCPRRTACSPRLAQLREGDAAPPNGRGGEPMSGGYAAERVAPT